MSQSSTRSVLVISEDAALRARLHSALIQQALPSQRIHEATSGRAGLHACQGHGLAAMGAPVQPELVLLDLVLSDLDALTLLHHLRGEAMDLPLPVVVLADLAEEDTIRAALDGGAHGFLLKTEIRPAVMGLTIHQALTQFERMQRQGQTPEQTTTASPRVDMAAIYQTLFESTSDAIFVGGPDGTYLDVNPAAAELLGYERAQLVGRHYSEFIPAEAYVLSREIAHAIRTTGSWAGDFPMRRADGTIIRTEYHSRFDGQRVLGIARDVTERRQRDDALRAAYAQIEQILESTTDAVYQVDGEWRFTYLNPQAERYFGCPKEELLGQRLWDRYAPAVGSLFYQQYQRAVSEGVAVHFEGLAPVRGRWVEAHAYPSADGLTIYFRDVTERWEREVETSKLVAQLKHERERLASLIANVPGVVWEAWGQPDHESQRIDFVSDYVETMLGYRVDEWLATPNFWLTIVHPDDQAEAARTAYEQFSSGKGGTNQFRWITKDGRVLHCEAVASVITDEAGQPLGMRGISFDRTELKQAEAELKLFNQRLEQRVQERTAELERSNRELDQFAYVASHDLKAPLRGINHLALWIYQDAADVLPTESKRHLLQLRGRIKRMEALLDDLLVYSRSNRVRYPKEAVHTDKLVRNILQLLAPPATMTVHLVGPLPNLHTERVALEQVLRNLLDNAIKHHDRPDGSIQVTAQAVGEYVEFRISDDGPGIAPEYHERIFGVFQTLRPRDEVEGSGMGLAIVKKLIESRGGRIWVNSTPGQGATFCFTWPKAEPSP
jgi:PAS domain S-box-containing protein